MKKVFALLLASLFTLMLCACGNDNPPDQADTTTTTGAPVETTEKVMLGETVSTDTVDFTLETAEFAYYVRSLSDSRYLVPTDDTDTIYAAKKGSCLVSMTVTFKNTDRTGNLDIAGVAGWQLSDWSVRYKGHDYPLYGFDLNNDNQSYIDMSPSGYVQQDTHRLTEKYDSQNILLGAGHTATVRFFGIIKCEPDALTDDFDLLVNVPNSKGEKEEFIYTVTAERREAVNTDIQKAKDNYDINSDAYTKVDDAVAADVSAVLQGEWTYTDGGVDITVTVSGNSIIVAYDVEGITWSNEGTYSVRRDNILITYTDGTQAFITYTLNNGVLEKSIVKNFD